MSQQYKRKCVSYTQADIFEINLCGSKSPTHYVRDRVSPFSYQQLWIMEIVNDVQFIFRLKNIPSWTAYVTGSHML